ncbi:hypothetical protein DSM43518_04015 [Mycobacterium marinum]|nr:hypothetical protein MM1218R_05372 [Mycobacterium marinum]AXN52702.1 hypothetical protein CCUG20998_05332 [Mycobacterium marinum]RFZ05669.1 hypothetical protein DSM43518_04015 [Mycobacterium marinum]RFZ08000.1 hypothetical protein VIMS_04264 [Mycobacterium marinum]RFZ11993.1 hypothetical protein DE4381_00943 [Mycobacterium marinum]
MRPLIRRPVARGDAGGTAVGVGGLPIGTGPAGSGGPSPGSAASAARSHETSCAESSAYPG